MIDRVPGLQIFDSVMLKDPAIVWGNLVKFGIGWVGICYNIVMMTQVYVHWQQPLRTLRVPSPHVCTETLTKVSNAFCSITSCIRI